MAAENGNRKQRNHGICTEEPRILFTAQNVTPWLLNKSTLGTSSRREPSSRKEVPVSHP